MSILFFLNIYAFNNVEEYDSKIPFRGQDFISNVFKISLGYDSFLNHKISSRINTLEETIVTK